MNRDNIFDNIMAVNIIRDSKELSQLIEQHIPSKSITLVLAKTYGTLNVDSDDTDESIMASDEVIKLEKLLDVTNAIV